MTQVFFTVRRPENGRFQGATITKRPSVCGSLDEFAQHLVAFHSIVLPLSNFLKFQLSLQRLSQSATTDSLHQDVKSYPSKPHNRHYFSERARKKLPARDREKVKDLLNREKT